MINIWNITTSNLDWQSMLISKQSKSMSNQDIGLQIHNRPGIRGKIKQLLVIHCDRNEVCSRSAVVYSWSVQSRNPATLHSRFEVKKIVKKAKEAKIDAIVAWDASVIKECITNKIDVHLSTQNSISNYESIQYC